MMEHHQACQLLHNKFVVVLGDSIQRSVYKDIVLLLQRDAFLSASQLKTKGELSFEKDCLVEGGLLGIMNNGTKYREVRQYRTDHHLVRFYFITQIYSQYMESILADFKNGIKPDLVIVNSCVWDVSRYSRDWAIEYRQNLNKFFGQLKTILPEETLVIWNMTMPLGKKITGGFLVPEIQHMAPTLRFDIIKANFFGATLAKAHGFDVLDMHFLFRFSLHLRMSDGIHWNAVAHRRITCLLLAHAAQAWGVQLTSPGGCNTGNRPTFPPNHFQQTTRDLVHSQGENIYPHPPQPVWRQEQHTCQYISCGPQFYQNDAPPHFTASYHSFETEDLRDPVWRQEQHLNQYISCGPRFYQDNVPPHFTAGKNIYPHPPQPVWRQEQHTCQYISCGPQFYQDDVPPHFTAGYHSFETEDLRGGDSSAAPHRPGNNLVMKKKRRRPYNPYTREKPRQLQRN